MRLSSNRSDRPCTLQCPTMRIFSRSFLFQIGMATALSGCSKYYYNPSPQVLPQYVQKIAIRPFTNHTSRPDLPDRLTMSVRSAFNRDGRWQIVEETEADGVLIGDITRYILIPTKNDANNVT